MNATLLLYICATSFINKAVYLVVLYTVLNVYRYLLQTHFV
jgi:hypothetical protein